MNSRLNTDHVEVIENKINEALQEIEEIRNQATNIKNPSDLENLETKIVKATDKLAGLITAKKIQQTLDSDEIRKQSEELIKSLPKPMKNQGKREVRIIPLRGEPVTVKAAYFSRKKKKKKKKR